MRSLTIEELYRPYMTNKRIYNEKKHLKQRF